MKEVFATIITIGDELLIGQVVDTNSAWIAQQLNGIGIALKKRVSVGDSYKDIVNALDHESLDADVILLTGGLGPTSDDITKKVLCDYFGGKMIVNQKALAHVKYLFEKVFNRPVTEVNLKQAEVPDVCEVIQNARGSAPGMVFRKEGKIFISMPGVPFEMQGIMTEGVLPLLSSTFSLPKISHRYITTAGIGESALAEEIKAFEEQLPGNIKLAYLPNYGMVRLRLSTINVLADAEEEIDQQYEMLKEYAAKYMISDNDDTLPVIVGKLLRSRNQTMATAESCTGGNIAHLITMIPGSSDYFRGSVVSYANEVKVNLLNVPGEIISSEGAVSEATVKAMLKGVVKTLQTDVGVATSGIMGPGGGTERKPVGTVWLSAGNAESQITQQLKLRFSRERNIEVASLMALNLLRKFIVDHC